MVEGRKADAAKKQDDDDDQSKAAAAEVVEKNRSVRSGLRRNNVNIILPIMKEVVYMSSRPLMQALYIGYCK